MEMNIDKDCMVSIIRYSTIAILICMLLSCCCLILPSLTFKCKGSNMYEDGLYEMYSNTSQQYSNTKAFNYKYIQLNVPDNLTNIIFGEALLYELGRDTRNDTRNDTKYQLHIKANLYVLDGNVLNFNNSNVTHSYKAYIVDNTNKTFIGELKKDGDGIYKLKYTSNENIMNPNSYIVVIYEKDGKEQILLQGKI
jgi:hypothetical protein